jgi:D-glycero-alpha-D-manno-heptose-7-phosphate kinase
VIAARTPLRIPLGGGLTDLRPYAERFGGVTISSTIGQSAFATVLPPLGERFEVHVTGGFETAGRLDELRNDLVREALRATGMQQTPVRVAVWVDVAGESGLGTSGAITVAVLHALAAYRGEATSPQRLAEMAAHIEVEVLRGASGYHDPHICARGGLLRLDYEGARVEARPLTLTPEARSALDASLLLFASGRKARTKPSLDLLSAQFESALPVLHEIKAVAVELEAALEAGDLSRTATCIGEKQRLKMRLPGNFSDAFVEDVVARVTACGAAAQVPGGKISGYVLVCCPEGQHEAVRAALRDLREVPLALSEGGTRATRV